jgi:DNA polymerase V
MGIVGVRLDSELRGRSCLELEECPSPKQGITCSRAFGRSVSTLVEMEEAVSWYVSRAAEKLREEGLVATVLTVFLMTNEFKDEPQYRNSVTSRCRWVRIRPQNSFVLCCEGLAPSTETGIDTRKRG